MKSKATQKNNRDGVHRRFFQFSRLFIISLIILCSGVTSVQADNRIVNVGVYENAPKVFTSEDGHPAGIFIDIIEFIAKNEGWRLNYVSGTWAEGLERLAQGKIDLMPDVAYTAAREKRFSFHEVQVLSSWFQAYARKGSGIQSLLGLDGKRIVVLERSVQQEAFSRFIEGFELNIDLMTVPDYKTMFEMVADGEADAGITNQFFGAMHARKYGLVDTAIVFEPSALFFATTKGTHKQLLNTIDNYMRDMKKDPQSMYYRSLKRWTSEEIRFKFPVWLQILGLAAGIVLLMSFGASVVLKHKINARTHELRQSEQKYRELVQNANSIILRWNRYGNITFINEYGQVFFGYPEAEIIGQHVVGTIVPNTESTGRDLRPLMEQICADPKAFEHNINENMRRDGSRVWIAWTNKAIFDQSGQIIEVFSIGSDITERKQAEEALRESEEKYRNLVERANDGICIVQDGILRYVNPRSVHMIGYAPKELIGAPFLDVFIAEEVPKVVERYKRRMAGKKVTPIYESALKHKNGRRIEVELNAGIISYKGKAADLIFVRDITERKQAEEELKKYREHLEELVKERTNELEKKTKELQEANIHLQEVDRLKSVFLASMSHELRTPLNSIIGFTGIILMGMVGDISEEQRTQLTMVKNSANHLLSLINDLLDISKIEAGKMELSHETFTLDNVLREVVETFSPTVNKKGLELRREVPEDITLFNDERRIKQVLMNLLSNAVKFTDQGTIKVSAKVLKRNILEMRITDTGIGIKQEDTNKLFEPFQQLDISLTKKYEGTGLGLYLCKKLAALLGGDITVKSEYKVGSTFIFTMPLQRRKKK